MILEITPQQIFQITTEHASSHVYYVESENSILLLRRSEGFLFRADYIKKGDLNDEIFKETHLKEAIPVIRAMDESILSLSVLEQVLFTMQELLEKTPEPTSLLNETSAID